MTMTENRATRICLTWMMVLLCGVILLSSGKAFAAGSVTIGNVKVTASQDFTTPANGEKITFPTFLSVEAATQSLTDSATYTISTTWFDQAKRMNYDCEAGNPNNKTFATGTWTLYISIHSVGGPLLPPGMNMSVFQEGGSLAEIKLGGVTFSVNNYTDDSVCYEADFQVTGKTKIQSFTLKTSGDFQAPVIGAPITYPDIVSVASTKPAGLEKQLKVTYGWWSVSESKRYDQEHGDTGTFSPGEYRLNVFVELVDMDRYEIVWENFEYGKPLNEISLGGMTCNVGALSENIICYTTTFAAKKMSVADCTYSAVADRIYTGKAIRPAVKLMAKLGGQTTTLKAGTDYTVSYKNNKAVGKAGIIITGKGNFTGKKTITFRIVPKGTSIRSAKGTRKSGKTVVTVVWKKQSKKMPKKRITGYELQFATDSKFKQNKKSVTVSGYKKTSKTVKNLKKASNYYVRIRTYMTISGKKYASKWSKAKLVKVKK